MCRHWRKGVLQGCWYTETYPHTTFQAVHVASSPLLAPSRAWRQTHTHPFRRVVACGSLRRSATRSCRSQRTPPPDHTASRGNMSRPRPCARRSPHCPSRTRTHRERAFLHAVSFAQGGWRVRPRAVELHPASYGHTTARSRSSPQSLLEPIPVQAHLTPTGTQGGTVKGRAHAPPLRSPTLGGLK